MHPLGLHCMPFIHQAAHDRCIQRSVATMSADLAVQQDSSNILIPVKVTTLRRVWTLVLNCRIWPCVLPECPLGAIRHTSDDCKVYPTACNATAGVHPLD